MPTVNKKENKTMQEFLHVFVNTCSIYSNYSISEHIGWLADHSRKGKTNAEMLNLIEKYFEKLEDEYSNVDDEL